MPGRAIVCPVAGQTRIGPVLVPASGTGQWPWRLWWGHADLVEMQVGNPASSAATFAASASPVSGPPDGGILIAPTTSQRPHDGVRVVVVPGSEVAVERVSRGHKQPPRARQGHLGLELDRLSGALPSAAGPQVALLISRLLTT